MKRLLKITMIFLLIISCTRDFHNLYEPKIPAIVNPLDTSEITQPEIAVSPCPNAYKAIAYPDTFIHDSDYQWCPFAVDYQWQQGYDIDEVFANPCNNDEIIYVKNYDVGFQNNGIYHYNFCTQTETEIIKGVFGAVDWSIKGWILFIDTDNHIYKIKPDGTGLKQLTFDGDYNNDPHWSPDGTKFIYNKVGSTSNIFKIIADQDGFSSDTLQSVTTSNIYGWIENDKIIIDKDIIGSWWFGIYEISSDEFTPIAKWNNNDPWVTDVQINPSQTYLYWYNFRTMYRTNTSTLTTDMLVEKNEYKWFEGLTIPQDEDPIYFIRNDFEPIDNCTYKAWSHIYVMDADGSNKLRLDLP
jgi:hypothetical protein